MPRGGAASWTGGGPPCPCRSSWLCGLWVGVGIVGVWGVGWVKWRVGICPCEGQQQQQLIAGYLGFCGPLFLFRHTTLTRVLAVPKKSSGGARSLTSMHHTRSSASPDPPTNYTAPPPTHTHTHRQQHTQAKPCPPPTPWTRPRPSPCSTTFSWPATPCEPTTLLSTSLISPFLAKPKHCMPPWGRGWPSNARRSTVTYARQMDRTEVEVQIPFAPKADVAEQLANSEQQLVVKEGETDTRQKKTGRDQQHKQG